MYCIQLESLAEQVEGASAQNAAAKAACLELEQRRQQLMDDNAACESAIGDVFNRKEVRVLLVSLRLELCTSMHNLPCCP